MQKISRQALQAGRHKQTDKQTNKQNQTKTEEKEPEAMEFLFLELASSEELDQRAVQQWDVKKGVDMNVLAYTHIEEKRKIER